MLLSTGKEQEARNARQTGRGHIRNIYLVYSHPLHMQIIFVTHMSCSLNMSSKIIFKNQFPSKPINPNCVREILAFSQMSSNGMQHTLYLFDGRYRLYSHSACPAWCQSGAGIDLPCGRN